MKILIGGLAATVLATAALAQTPPAEPMASAPTTSDATPPAEPMPPRDAAPAAATNPAMLVQKDGKWWNGDRMATEAEIAEHQRTHPQ